jgi:hypothetical protein
MRAISCATKLPIEKPSRSTRWNSIASRNAIASWAIASTALGVLPVEAPTPTLSNVTTRRSAASASMRAGIEVEVLPTAEAVERYGRLDPRKTAAALHLTC